MNEEKFNLFVYGSLREPEIFKSVCGLSFTLNKSKAVDGMLFAELALLDGHRKVSPDNVYFYAVIDPSSRIEGYVIYDVPASAIAEIDRYEGKRYTKETIQVNTAGGLIFAQAYLASHESMRKHFGDRFHVNLIHELWLRKRIEDFIQKHTRPGEKSDDAELERRAERELLGTTERDLVMSHYRSDAVSDYYLEHELDRPRPSIQHLYADPQAQPYIENYLSMVIRQVMLNQLDAKIQNDYRFELEHMRSSERYFKRSLSLLIGLWMINGAKRSLQLITDKALESLPYRNHDLVDYVKYAVKAARSFFDHRVVESYLARIRANFQPGLIPLGAEIELSNVGAQAVEPQRSHRKQDDDTYNDFKYFNDFGLGLLSWKLGGYIDDHSGSTDYERRTGFLELAPGRLNIEGQLSRPATADPWLLNQLINAIINFYDVSPHSLHLSFQLRKRQIGHQKILPLGFAKCLLVLGGGSELKDTGRLWVSRMGYDEITRHDIGEELMFARMNKRTWHLGDDMVGDRSPVQATTYVQQYKFIRLEKRANYEPLIMCLKGLQIAYNPGDYLTVDQLKDSKLRREYEDLKQWAEEPSQISPQTINKFIKTVQNGLMNEAHHKPSHKLHYIDWAISAINVQLRLFNQQVKKSRNAGQ